MHKLQPPPDEPSPRRRGSALVVAVHAWMDRVGRVIYYVGFPLMVGCWYGATWLCTSARTERLPAALPLAGILLIVGGLIEIFLGKPMNEARESRASFWSLWADGTWGSINYGPASYRLCGCIAIGIGIGMVVWAMLPNAAVVGTAGIVTCLAVWVWTWFAFPSWDE